MILLESSVSDICDIVQALGVCIALYLTVQSGRKQAKERHEERLEDAENRSTELELARDIANAKSKHARVRMRFELREKKRGRLVSNYPSWSAAVHQYLMWKPHYVSKTGRDRAILRFERAVDALFRYTLAIMMDETADAAREVESLQIRLLQWSGQQGDEIKALNRACAEHVWRRLQAWTGYRSAFLSQGAVKE